MRPPAPLDDLLTDLLPHFDDARKAGLPVTPQQLCADTPHLLAPFSKLLKDLGRVDPVFNGTDVVSADEVVFDVPETAKGNEQSDLVTDLYDAIDELDEELKEVVQLLYFQGLTQAGADVVLDVHEDTMKRRWAKARVILAGRLAAFRSDEE